MPIEFSRSFANTAQISQQASTVFTSDYIAELNENADKAGYQNLGSGADHFTYSGTTWFDPISHRSFTLQFSQSVNGGAGNDVIATGGGSDSVYGGGGSDTINGWDGNDKIYGGSGDDDVRGGSGDDAVYGGSGNDAVTGDDGNDTLSGGSGNDVLYGAWGNDRLDGGSGNDVLNGGFGTDRLTGGTGADALTGGAGADTFVFTAVADSSWTTAGTDRITDFSHAEGDRIDLHGLDIASGAQLHMHAPGEGPTAGSVWIGAVQHDAHGNATQTVQVNAWGEHSAAYVLIDVTLSPGSAALTAGDLIF